MIPKILHQVYLGTAPVPDLAWEFSARWKTLNPTWDYRLWNQDNLPRLICEKLYARSWNTGHRSDILRYELLHRFGGVYSDLDFEPFKPLNEVVFPGCRFFLGQHEPIWAEGLERVLDITIIGSEPGHPLLARALRELPEWAEAHWDQPVSVRTGPNFFQPQVDAWVRDWRAVSKEAPPITLFPPPVFYPYLWTQKENALLNYPAAIAVHRWWATWVGQPS